MWILAVLACDSGARPSASWGQWIWTDRDVDVFRRSAQDLPGLSAAVWVATIGWDGAATTVALGHSPVGLDDPALVIRIDDSFHDAWDNRNDGEVAALLDAPLGRILAMAADSGLSILEVQLDYDCPERRLSRWAAVIPRLTALDGRPPWVTSLPVHLADPGYGAEFRGVIAGHLLQVFDTGTPVAEADATRERVEQAEIPWRLGVGAFERTTTSHRAWFGRLDACAPPLCDGVWVFPGGNDWTELVNR